MASGRWSDHAQALRVDRALPLPARRGLGDLPGTLAAYAEGLSFHPDDAELLFRKAVTHRRAGQPAEAETTFRRILTLKRHEQFCSVDQGIYGHLTLRNLAALATEWGDPHEAHRLWRAVLGECPDDPEATATLEASNLPGIFPSAPRRPA